jgi:predicted enzyme related to lactoylglutathione lyase
MAVKVWYHVRDLNVACAFYTGQLGFEVAYLDPEARWARLQNGTMEVGLAQGDPQPADGIATLDVEDVKGAAERLREAGVDVGTVLELHGQMRLLDIFDPDGNRIQLAQELAG